ncbi:MAG TPA: pirin family protein [Steroidobacteraceae bacterium]
MIERSLSPPTRDLGDGFLVRRALPSDGCRSIGPFVFFDHFGPTSFAAGRGLDVRPHPHIGLATVTYLFEGEIVHRDSLGNAQVISPGAVNWMVAGAGIVHSERTAADTRRAPSSLTGIQSWVALPLETEECAPSFVHHAAKSLPVIENAGRRIRLIAGALFGERSPVATLSPMGYADADLDAGAQLAFPAEYVECALYLVEGAIDLAGQRIEAPRLLVLRAGEPVRLRAATRARVMLLAGEPLGPRHVWWNFVSSSHERIEAAKSAWRAGRFEAVPGDEEEFIPLPRERPPHEASPGADESEAL